ncbi:hypothetical protein [Methylophaga thiooxydans]|uniref:hypothetical protein n=1 Tax=Methylophaga thiooxydans TaxID=392484 RepID=UPI002354ED83|nr:hypothetical protein [Methylophaga thiooxydans]
MPSRPSFTNIEKRAMQEASIRGYAAWDRNPDLATLKEKIKSFSLIKTGSRCCYCGRNIYGEFGMVIDIEHILPKAIYPKYMFRGGNLSASCKRCNMNIKKSKTDFFIGIGTKKAGKFFRSSYYKFIHPNLDNYDAHLLLISSQVGRKVMLKYMVVNESNKGSYTYAYFKLDRLEKNSFDTVQGGRGRSEIENPDLQEAFDAIAP